jgi:hypothetical protein
MIETSASTPLRANFAQAISTVFSAAREQVPPIKKKQQTKKPIRFFIAGP